MNDPTTIHATPAGAYLDAIAGEVARALDALADEHEGRFRRAVVSVRALAVTLDEYVEHM